jgi:AcrR family transcriptional regulator
MKERDQRLDAATDDEFEALVASARADVGQQEPSQEVQPLTKRGLRTRARLLKAAGIVFERDGYLNAKITDITATAGVSNGSFYTYFKSKEAIFSALIREVNEQMYNALSLPHEEGQGIEERIEQVTRAYVQAYRKHAGLIGILEQVATFNAEFREMRRQIRQTFRRRTERWIRRLHEQGIGDLELPPQCTAEALTSMVSNFCYVSMVLGENYDEDEAVHTLTRLWIRGIGLEPKTTTRRRAT